MEFGEASARRFDWIKIFRKLFSFQREGVARLWGLSDGTMAISSANGEFEIVDFSRAFKDFSRPESKDPQGQMSGSALRLYLGTNTEVETLWKNQDFHLHAGEHALVELERGSLLVRTASEDLLVLDPGDFKDTYALRKERTPSIWGERASVSAEFARIRENRRGSIPPRATEFSLFRSEFRNGLLL